MAAPANRPAWEPPSTLPPLYASWIAGLLDSPPPHEAEATCQNCAMWPSATEATAPAEVFFHRDTK